MITTRGFSTTLKRMYIGRGVSTSLSRMLTTPVFTTMLIFTTMQVSAGVGILGFWVATHTSVPTLKEP